MQGTKPPRFSPTLSIWPSEPRRLPQVAIYDKPHAADASMIGHRQLPEDFVLQEALEVTAENFDDFARSWGRFASDWDASNHLPADTPLRERGMMNVDILQTLVRHYLAYAEGDEQAMLAAWKVEPAPSDARQAWDLWEQEVNEALRAFPMFVRMEVLDGDPMDEMQRRTTYSVAVLQLAQIATEGRVIKRCANELCPNGGLFTRQRSTRRRYEGTGHAEGIKYCSATCARAQSERERRRRRRDEKEATRG